METLEPLSNLTSLTRLEISRGEDLRGEGLWHLPTLTVFDTPKLFEFGWGLQDEDQDLQLLRRSSKLRELETNEIAGVLAAPICTLLSSSLTNLSLGYFLGRHIEVQRFTKEQEEALHLLTSLQELKFMLFSKLQCLPAGLHRLTNIKRLEIGNCPAIRSLPKNGLPSSLQKLKIWACESIRSLPKDGLPSSLQQLEIITCPSFWSLPKDGLPSSLQKLKIDRCPALRSLPKQGLPSSLQELDVSDCRNEELKQRCRKFTGTIPKIRL